MHDREIRLVHFLENHNIFLHFNQKFRMLRKALLCRKFATAVGGKKVGFIGLGSMGLPMT